MVREPENVLSEPALKISVEWVRGLQDGLHEVPIGIVGEAVTEIRGPDELDHIEGRQSCGVILIQRELKLGAVQRVPDVAGGLCQRVCR